MPEKSILSAKSLSVGYRKNIIVDGLEFEVKSGEILTLIGSNGAGKSTVLKTIAAQLPAISGEVYIGGGLLKNMTEREISRKMSLLLTGKLSAERMTCEDVISTGRYPYTGRLGILSDEDRRIVREAMELTAVGHLHDCDFECISDGQRQCVMLARAICQQPRVMILDEPTSFLDIRHKLKLLTLLRELVREKNIAVVQSLHELELAQKFSDRILCIRDGKADRTGTPEEIFAGDYICELYGIENGSYDPVFSTAEPQKVSGEPQVFVIGGGGRGIPIYHRLQRQGIPFAAGVIHENDLDYPVANSLSAELVSGAAFEPVGETDIETALEVMSRCSVVICCIEKFGTMNMGNKILLETAEKQNKLKFYDIS